MKNTEGLKYIFRPLSLLIATAYLKTRLPSTTWRRHFCPPFTTRSILSGLNFFTWKINFKKYLILLNWRSGNVNLQVEKLLLMLPCLRHVDTIIRKFWAKVKQVNFICWFFIGSDRSSWSPLLCVCLLYLIFDLFTAHTLLSLTLKALSKHSQSTLKALSKPALSHLSLRTGS